MKIAIIGDTHFGYKRFEADSFKQGEEALLSAAEKADMLLLAGDIFDTRIPSMETLGKVASIFEKLKHRKWNVVHEKVEKGEKDKRKIPIAAIHGTHERRTKENVNPIQLLAKMNYLIDVDNNPVVFEKDNKEEKTGNEEKAEKVCIQGMGGVPDDFAKNALRVLDPKPIPEMFNIFVMHQSIKELMYVGDKTNSLISLNDLPKGFDLYINGHIHDHKVSLNGKLIIPGSTVVTQLKENEQKNKGYVIYDTKKRKYEFVPI